VLGGFFVLAVGLVVLGPQFVVPQLQAFVARKTGGQLAVRGPVRLQFSPSLAVCLGDVSITGDSGQDVLMHADSAEVPLTFGQLFQRKLRIKDLRLTAPTFNFVLSGRGDAETAGGDARKSNAETPPPPADEEPFKLVVDGATITFLDERQGQALAFHDVSASATITPAGELDAAGGGSVNGHFIKAETHIDSLKRIPADGSPASFAITSNVVTMAFDGRLATRGALGLVGNVHAEAADARVLAKWFGASLAGSAGLKNFTLTSALDAAGEVITLKKANIGLDGMAATGDLTLDLSHNKPHVAATLSTDEFTLDPYLAAAPAAASGNEGGEADWSTTATPFAALNGIDGDLHLSAFKFIWGETVISPVDLKANLANGKLTTELPPTALYGGTTSATLTLNAATAVPEMAFRFDGAKVDAGKLLRDFTGHDWLTGLANLRLDVAASGKNQREMMSTLKGNFAIGLGSGQFIGIDVSKLVGKVSQAIADGWGDGAQALTRFDQAQASFAIADGIATTSDLDVRGQAFSFTGAGQVDMLRRAVDFKVDPTVAATGGETVGLPVQVAVRGPWTHPKIYPDVANILSNPAQAFDTLQGLGMPKKTLNKLEKKGRKLLEGLLGN
jgi:AsmA protein